MNECYEAQCHFLANLWRSLVYSVSHVYVPCKDCVRKFVSRGRKNGFTQRSFANPSFSSAFLSFYSALTRRFILATMNWREPMTIWRLPSWRTYRSKLWCKEWMNEFWHAIAGCSWLIMKLSTLPTQSALWMQIRAYDERNPRLHHKCNECGICCAKLLWLIMAYLYGREVVDSAATLPT